MAWENPSTDSTSEPASRAISAQLLVGFCAVRLPLRSASDLIELSSLRVTITPCEIEYGSERSYFCLRSVADRDLVGDDVEAVGLQRREHGVPRRLDEFDVHAELLGDCLGDIDVVACELSALLRIVERIRRVDAFGADAQHTGGFDRVIAVGARRTARREQQRGQAAARPGRLFVR